ncbi:hypothetical protein WICMUC_000363 [Wickerhamomyces mucosus]|uniref:Large ribosomal subunit protein mL59 domain-containing protein n=1 Tax=Wickerhamomyces mucosus TaxID=1378264 RepID=A0A9P8PXN9_9ASCO|nr:hypothetical protein WICMUC_000363 [Wickerhamomyces mucosus]
MIPTLGLKQASSKVIQEVSYFDKLPAVLQRFFTRYPPVQFHEYSKLPTLTTAPDANPFLPNKHPITGKTHNPKYSLRRQSVLWKLAYQHGVEDCLPNLQNNKIFYEEKYHANEFMRGQLRPKGSKYEKNKFDRKAKIAKAVEEADEKITSVKGNKYKRLLERKAKDIKTWI